ncbi:hypothetical protein K438DRAFT_1962683 [Mycena galopus ATCC 62051]|nr:hypothetical protein K438DRAFT_1962683 [Mycena galopus ATCC 62051]
MDSFTTISKKVEDVVLPPINEDGSGGSSGSCVVCKEDTSFPPSMKTAAGAPAAAASLPKWLCCSPHPHHLITSIYIIRLRDFGQRPASTFLRCGYSSQRAVIYQLRLRHSRNY